MQRSEFQEYANNFNVIPVYRKLLADGETPIGDPRWHEQGPAAVMVVNEVQNVTNAVGQEVIALSNKDFVDANAQPIYINNFFVSNWIDRTFYVNDVSVFKTSYNV